MEFYPQSTKDSIILQINDNLCIAKCLHTKNTKETRGNANPNHCTKYKRHKCFLFKWESISIITRLHECRWKSLVTSFLRCVFVRQIIWIIICWKFCHVVAKSVIFCKFYEHNVLRITFTISRYFSPFQHSFVYAV